MDSHDSINNPWQLIDTIILESFSDPNQFIEVSHKSAGLFESLIERKSWSFWYYGKKIESWSGEIIEEEAL